MKPSSGKNQVDLAVIVEEEFAKKTAAEWLDIFGAAGVPCGKINSYKEALSHPQAWISYALIIATRTSFIVSGFFPVTRLCRLR